MTVETNTLQNCDALVLLGALANESIDLVLTDPPFGQNLGYGRGQLGERYIVGDEDLSWLPNVVTEMWRVLKQDRHLLMFCQWRTYSEFERVLKSVGFKVRTVAIWDKGNAGLSGGGSPSNTSKSLCAGKAKQGKDGIAGMCLPTTV